ncbi:MAG TPA: aspartate aminotransferase family protein [Candidatus Acidoferrales bacterium]|nr:aspartate aminotransferase family protein [Candidatus Acidoferrales bacterium]
MTQLNTYARASLTIVAGQGCELIDHQGRRYLDFIGGLAVSALGHAHPVIADAVAAQARRLTHASNLYDHEPAATLARELVARSKMSGAFFCNSGTEANEAAIKLARKWAHRQGERERHTILACTGSFHGRTLGSLAATDNASYREGFEPLPAGFAFVRFNDSDALRRALDDRVAAFIVEPVQGESGVNVAQEDFLAEARRLCNERGALLIFDEVQCGMGRTGSLFAFEQFGVRPDVVTMAKALANGLPIGAVLADERCAAGFAPGDHGSTFGGSPVPCAAALAHLRLRDELDLDAHVLRRSHRLLEALTQLAQRVPDVLETPRGLGLLIGVPVRAPHRATAIVAEARQCGLLIGSAGNNTLRFAPPLIVSSDDVERALSLLALAIGRFSREAQPAVPIGR